MKIRKAGINKLIIVFAALVGLIIYGFISAEQNRENNYHSFISALREKNVEEAEELSYKLPSDYKDMTNLMNYFYGLKWYQEGKYEYSSDSLYEIIDYEGEFKDDIEALKKETSDILYEKTREELAIKYEIKVFQKEKAKTGMPEEYMNESLVSGTLMGEYDEKKVEDVYKGKQTKYYWYDTSGKNIILIVTCKDGKVTDVTRYFVSDCYDKDGKLITKTIPSKTRTGTTRGSGNSQTSNDDEDDPFDAKDYGDEEDFYDDYYDEFFDYEEAEDYWNEHQ